MATPTRRKPPTKKKAATPAAEPTSAQTGEAVRTDISPGGAGAEGPSEGSASVRGAVDRPAPTLDDDLHDAIARRAYEIYERNGRPEGRDAEHWRQAEAEIRAEHGAR